MFVFIEKNKQNKTNKTHKIITIAVTKTKTKTTTQTQTKTIYEKNMEFAMVKHTCFAQN